LAGLDIPLISKTLEGGERCDRKRGCLFERSIGRLLRQFFFCGAYVLSKGSA